MEFQKLTLLCLACVISTCSLNISNGRGATNLAKIPTQDYSSLINTTQPSFSTIYKQGNISRVLFISKRNSSSSDHPHKFREFGKTLNRRDSTGWGSWGVNLMNQYFGDGNLHSGGISLHTKPNHHKLTQAAQISKIIKSKAHLMSQMLELSRISTNKFADMILFLGKLKSVPLPLFGKFGNPNNPHHYFYNGLPTVSPDKINTHGWKSSGNDHAARNVVEETGSGWGWNGGGSGNTFQNLGYSLGSSLAGVSKFAKLVGEGYSFGTEGQKWLSHGAGFTNINEYYPKYKATSDSNKGQFNSDQNSGPDKLNAYANKHHSTSGSGFGYNYGSGNEYSHGGWNGGVTSTSGGGIGGEFEEGGSDVTTGLTRLPEFKRL